MYEEITVHELKKMLGREDGCLIDVREPFEHQEGHIEKAINIPLSQLSLIKIQDPTQPIIVHCRFDKRSQEACARLFKENPSLELYRLKGGISAWKEAGYIVNVKKSNNTWPIERQTQITVGFLGVVGLLAGTFINPYGYFLTAIINLGLMSAGLTGWCGMAKLLAKMPWNKN